MRGLKSMHIWKVVDMPTKVHLVYSKLVLNIKTDTNRIPYKFKACFCTCGFSQKEGLDYMEKFAPVVPHNAIQAVLVITAKFDWELNSFDMKQAYLNAKLEHDIYLKPPEGTNVLLGKVYKLVKSLYSLKQFLREWYKELDSHLRGTGNNQVVILVYVNDMLIAAPQRSQVDAIKQAVVKKWKIEDNGSVKEFLKIKIMCDQENQTIDLDQ
ncbi:uncharacterized protein UBRO_21013 [Ustilago bromivora]|uniref:Reverse transcriptase Ty1/copia-type domain-containing protein n=1 Tax=Ustilago bromivora TaxID=307758 RepID=A0A1K0GB74_9BASI|nr:uncharacterized protein UBRO_21013 [Ustilago bromivora]